VLLGADPTVRLTRRAQVRLTELRDERRGHVDAAGTVVEDSDNGLTWWTWAGGRTNATLIRALDGVVDSNTVDDFRIKLRDDVEPADFKRLRHSALNGDLPLPHVSER
jgi:ATP-dependent Lhr-like helicase